MRRLSVSWARPSSCNPPPSQVDSWPSRLLPITGASICSYDFNSELPGSRADALSYRARSREDIRHAHDTGRADIGRRPSMPAEARHPHSLQTGRPPNWHGVTRDLISAEYRHRPAEKCTRFGERGGSRRASKTEPGIVHLRKSHPYTRQLRDPAARSAGKQALFGALPLPAAYTS